MNDAEGALEIRTHPSPTGPVVVHLAGELDHYTGPRLRVAVEEVLRDPGAGIIADLSDLHYCDSTGMTMIITAYRRAQAVGSSFAVAGLSPAMDQLFRVAGLDQLFPLHASVQAAAEALRGN
ncbi:STAS domain-containing protein [Streptomyces sp. NPDC006654]|uniref:STAS domain-containing protein n=1 Tax=Streptomyces sp. NPDC006654 TaxID=3156897 RepID=UPI0033E8E011